MAIRQVYNAASLSTSAGATNIPIYLGRSVSTNGVNIVTFLVGGQLAGAQLKLQMGPNSAATGPWWDIASTTISTSGVALNVEIADGFYIRPYLASVSAGATSVDAWVGVGSYSTR